MNSFNMKLSNRIILLPALAVLISVAGCAGNGNKKENSKTSAIQNAPQREAIIIDEETKLLLKDLSENGDYVNGRQFPSLIKASVVHDILENNILVIDIRSHQDYSAGHVKGAINKDYTDLPDYFESGIKPFEYDRIIIVSSDGQAASYATSLLRLMGYGNVYSMRWGMSGWNSIYARKGWFAGCSSEFQSQLEARINEKPMARSMPELNTGMSTGEEIGMTRFKYLFSEDLKNVTIDASDIFSNPSDYYVINYDRRDKYESGHIPGAVRYKPGATLSMVKEMATIPIDKTIVIYCGTGHNSGFVTAYLRLFGYDARTLKYGNNSFMYDKMLAERSTLSWLPFSTADINDFEVVK